MLIDVVPGSIPYSHGRLYPVCTTRPLNWNRMHACMPTLATRVLLPAGSSRHASCRARAVCGRRNESKTQRRRRRDEGERICGFRSVRLTRLGSCRPRESSSLRPRARATGRGVKLDGDVRGAGQNSRVPPTPGGRPASRN